MRRGGQTLFDQVHLRIKSFSVNSNAIVKYGRCQINRWRRLPIVAKDSVIMFGNEPFEKKNERREESGVMAAV